MPSGTYVKAGHLRPGTDTIVERYTSGSISARIKVADILPCPTDASHIHVVPDSANGNGRISCYYREASVELL